MNTTPEEYYAARIKSLNEEIKNTKQKRSGVSWLRLANMVAIGLVIYYNWPNGGTIAAIVIPLLALFVF